MSKSNQDVDLDMRESQHTLVSDDDEDTVAVSSARRASRTSIASTSVSIQSVAAERSTYYDGDHRRNSTASIATAFQETSARVADRRRRGAAASKEEHKPKNKAEVKEEELVNREVQMDDHIISAEELEGRLETDFKKGITVAEAERRIEKYGFNALTPPEQTPKWILFMRELTTPFALVLWAAALLCFVAFIVQQTGSEGYTNPLGNEYENLVVGVALVLVVLVTAIFSFVQTVKSGDAMAGFAAMAPQNTTVIRGGELMTLSAKFVVPGDIVKIISGDKIPADVRIIEATNMKVDNASLTGESEPQTRTEKTTHDNPLETSNLAFSGTSCVEGSGIGVVIYTADDTVIGQLANLVSGAEEEDTPMMVEINSFVKWITIFAASLALIFLVVGLVRDGVDTWSSLIVIIIGIVVGTVPEGLPSAVAVSLALAASRMAAKNVLVTEQLSVVETLGRTTIIASDKTGTLTQNRMTVSHVWTDMDLLSADTLQANGVKDRMVAEDSSFNDLYKIGALCSRSEFAAGQNEVAILDREVIGDASETAILKFCELLAPVSTIRTHCPKVAEIPFNSTNKFQVSIHSLPKKDKHNAAHILVMKGAPERILDRATRIGIKGKECSLDADVRAKYDTAYLQIGNMGERVLGFAYLYLDAAEFPLGFNFDTENVNFPLEDLVFGGLMSMIDPPRESVPGAIQQCHKAGIRVAMVTGDHPVTAQAIARTIGLLTPEGEASGRAVVIHGESLLKMTEAELDVALRHDEIVFARTSPAQKLRIVEGLQRANHIVAVTGDGVNDSPALKKANVGVAMGIAGTDVSKDASDIILLDDNFGSIVNGIAEGRVIFDNMKKSIAYTLSSKAPQLIPYIFSFFLWLPPPLNALLILSIDIGTDLLPAISLAYEVAESSVMDRPPRGDSSRDKLVTIASIIYSYAFLGILQCIAGFTSYFILFGTGCGIQNGGWSFDSIWLSNGEDFIYSEADMTDSEGIVWTQENRLDLSRCGTSGYFSTVLIVRMAVLLTTKTVERSLFKHGLKSNKVLLIGLVEIVFIPLFLVYVPGIQWVFGTYPIPWYSWLVPFPYMMLCLGLDEWRKAAIRRGGWSSRNLRF
ncbi:hypothetical protein SARC_03061 [Sphaeroforma arctica JP610]|uniref:Sodium/potassium-transporting ATPase subunit alpha n=1 Tax=Sphaeroforma arctica JP610 TaxID=667725 RepID=A0A0L0G6S3_9EUKA|nr:hypothetical protein SARC_03061 [Sphaeroforma arctica JP610]KNC84720.1 hypothetical protein SARC_03061 [Sphaeroforma arctica JP610]|eukprot:XP_014158622.1 hypothetical protein SARC_03061 [Sphaeroforma arctica JP610]